MATELMPTGLTDSDFARDLVTRELAPTKQLSEQELCTWVAQIIGPGSDACAGRLHAKGFDTSGKLQVRPALVLEDGSTWVLQGMQISDLRRAGFTNGDARALNAAVTNAMMSQLVVQRAEAFTKVSDMQQQHDVSLDQLKSELVEQQAELENVGRDHAEITANLGEAVRQKLEAYEQSLAGNNRTLREENNRLEQTCGAELERFGQQQQDLTARLHHVTQHAGKRYTQWTAECIAAVDTITGRAFDPFKAKVNQLEHQIQELPTSC